MSITMSLGDMDVGYFNNSNIHIVNAYYVLGRLTGILLYLVFTTSIWHRNCNLQKFREVSQKHTGNTCQSKDLKLALFGSAICVFCDTTSSPFLRGKVVTPGCPSNSCSTTGEEFNLEFNFLCKRQRLFFCPTGQVYKSWITLFFIALPPDSL